jgi:2'-5' RNA ligase
MALLVLAYPEISPSDYQWIQAFRKTNDQLFYEVVEPHFTLVFPVTDWDRESFVAEIKKQAQGIRSFKFCIRCATVNKDSFSEYYHTFLVPDEGYSQIVKLHDRLYTDKLFEHRRLDIDFIPHIGVGNSKDPLSCYGMAQRWNERDFVIEGEIKELEVVNYENETVYTLEKIILGQ